MLCDMDRLSSSPEMELPLDLSVNRSKCRSPRNVIVQNDSPDDVTKNDGDVKMSLVDTHVWSAFSSRGTEMIINRNGRRMFPNVAVSISGLNPAVLYDIWLEIIPADDMRYKYVQDRWISVSKSDPNPHSAPYLHPDSPKFGSYWMQKQVSFARLKLTNNRHSLEGKVLLQSMHKYKAKIYIKKTDQSAKDSSQSYCFEFDETSFIAVTAYQNNDVTKMKIHNNPFAKAFRDKHVTDSLKEELQARKNEKKSVQMCRKRKRSDKQCGDDTAKIQIPSTMFTMSSLPNDDVRRYCPPSYSLATSFNQPFGSYGYMPPAWMPRIFPSQYLTVPYSRALSYTFDQSPSRSGESSVKSE